MAAFDADQEIPREERRKSSAVTADDRKPRRRRRRWREVDSRSTARLVSRVWKVGRATPNSDSFFQMHAACTLVRSHGSCCAALFHASRPILWETNGVRSVVLHFREIYERAARGYRRASLASSFLSRFKPGTGFRMHAPDSIRARFIACRSVAGCHAVDKHGSHNERNMTGGKGTLISRSRGPRSFLFRGSTRG